MVMKIFVIKVLSIFLLAALFISCAEELVGIERPNTPLNNFEYFWKSLDAKYGLFCVKSVDWQKVYDTHRDRVNEKTTDEELYAVLISMINTLNDNHVNLYPTTGSLPVYPSGLLRVVNDKVI